MRVSADVVIPTPDWREEARYGVYTCEAGELVLVATAEDPGGVGQAIVAQAEDELEVTGGLAPRSYGVLDGRAGRWLSHPDWAGLRR